MRRLHTVFALSLFFLVSCHPDDPIIFKDKNGRVLKQSDLDSFNNKSVVDSKNVDPLASRLNDEAVTLIKDKRYDEALIKLREAAGIQPDWAYPVFNMAISYLNKSEYDSALYYYKKTDRLEPAGYYDVKTAVYTLEGEKAGIFPEGLYQKYLNYPRENNKENFEKYIRDLTVEIPEYAPAWRELAFILDDPDERSHVIEQGLSKNPDAEIKGVLLVNKALILNIKGKNQEAKEMLYNLLLTADLTTGNQIRAKTSLKYL